jgi:hypothetical protein
MSVASNYYSDSMVGRRGYLREITNAFYLEHKKNESLYTNLSPDFSLSSKLSPEDLLTSISYYSTQIKLIEAFQTQDIKIPYDFNDDEKPKTDEELANLHNQSIYNFYRQQLPLRKLKLLMILDQPNGWQIWQTLVTNILNENSQATPDDIKEWLQMQPTLENWFKDVVKDNFSSAISRGDLIAIHRLYSYGFEYESSKLVTYLKTFPNFLISIFWLMWDSKPMQFLRTLSLIFCQILFIIMMWTHPLLVIFDDLKYLNAFPNWLISILPILGVMRIIWFIYFTVIFIAEFNMTLPNSLSDLELNLIQWGNRIIDRITQNTLLGINLGILIFMAFMLSYIDIIFIALLDPSIFI